MLEDLDNLKKYFREYLEVQFDLIRLQTAECMSRALSKTATIAVFSYLLFFILLFGSLSAGFYIASLLNSRELAFLIVSGFYFFLLILFLIFRKSIIDRPVIKIIIHMFFPESHEKK